ncbi:MAG: glycoside hydrolase, family 38, partial [Thermoleophilia bacterium]|nr:glycoside hydrolase, family 38 [Thermoleophilia bacterium]
DGSDVLAILQAAPDIMGYWSYELGGRGNAVDSPVPYDAARRLAQHLAPSASTDMMLFAAGADHDTIHANLPAIVANLRAVFGDQAEVRLTGLDAAVQHVRRAEQRIVAAGGALQRHRGEMRGSRFAPILASIFSARVELKQQNDALQQLLERHVEPLMASAVAAGVRPARDVEPFLRHAWRLTLENHPHDSIGGCSVDLVHEEMPARTLRATEVALGLVEDLRMALGLGDVEVVHDAEGRGGIAERADGTIVALAPGPVNALVPLAELQVVDAVQVTDDGVSAGDVSARVADVRGRPMLELSFPSAAPVVVDFLDEADGGDEYDFSDLTGSGVLVARIERWQTQALSDGAVGELEVVHVLDLPISLTEARTDRSPVTTRHELVSRVRVSTVTQLVEVHTTFTNAALDHRLRVRVTPASPAGPASPDHVESLGHFAIVERPVRPADPATTWRQLPTGLDHTLGAVRLVDESGMPLVLAAGRGIHEYEAIERSDAAVPGVGLELTLVRSVGFLSRDDIAGRPEHAGPALATPGAQCQGARRVDLAFGAGPTASFDSARAFLAPPLVFDAFTPERIDESGAQARRHDVALVTPVDARERIERLGLVASGSGVVVSALKLADDGSGDLIARWWAPTQGNGGRARLHVGVPVSAAWRARLDETAQGPATFDENGMLDVAVRPGSIVTVRVSLAAT